MKENIFERATTRKKDKARKEKEEEQFQKARLICSAKNKARVGSSSPCSVSVSLGCMLELVLLTSSKR